MNNFFGVNVKLSNDFFDRDAAEVAKALLGKVICHYTGGEWRRARIIETEAYYIHEKGSHASLGLTESRQALFMPAGTIYMYYARGGDSFNISCKGEGNAVLIKSGFAAEDNSPEVLKTMQEANPIIDKKTGKSRPRPLDRLCSGQTLLCKAMGLKVTDWRGKTFTDDLYIENISYEPANITVGKRLGIPKGRDEDLLLRFIDAAYIKSTTNGRA